jgi:hypothetical protein
MEVFKLPLVLPAVVCAFFSSLLPVLRPEVHDHHLLRAAHVVDDHDPGALCRGAQASGYLRAVA